MPRLLIALALAVALAGCDTSEPPAAFGCEVPPAPAEPSRFLAMGYFVGFGPGITANGLVVGTTADGVTDTLAAYPYEGVHGEFFYSDPHPRGGVVSSTRRPVGGQERSRLDVRAPDGATRTLDFAGPDYVFVPRWRPDGARVLFVLGEVAEPRWSLVEWDPGTGATRTVVAEDRPIDPRHVPAYAPDGRSVAYQDGPFYDGDLFVADVATGARVRLGARDGVRLFSRGFHPVRWSGDSRWVVSYGERQVTADSVSVGFYAARADGSGVVEVAYDSVSVSEVAGWLPGQDCVVFRSTDDHAYVGDLRGGSRRLSAERLPGISGVNVFERTLRPQYALTPGGGRMAMFHRTVRENRSVVTVVDLSPFAVRQVPLAPVGPDNEYRLADWIGP